MAMAMAMVNNSINYSAVAAALLLFIGLARASTYTVGGPNGGWDIMTDQKTWGSSQTFVVGDNLAFQYSANHDVSEVTKTEYDTCQTTSSIQKYTGGSTVIPLSAPGKRYFICSTPGHCSAGMKLEVNTLAGSSAPAAAPALLGQVPAPEPVPETTPLPPAPAVFGPVSEFGPTPSPSPSPFVSGPEPVPQSGSDLSPSPVVSVTSPSESSIPSASATNPDTPATDDPTDSTPLTRTSTDSPNSAAKSVALVKAFGLVVAVVLAL